MQVIQLSYKLKTSSSKSSAEHIELSVLRSKNRNGIIDNYSNYRAYVSPAELNIVLKRGS